MNNIVNHNQREATGSEKINLQEYAAERAGKKENRGNLDQ